MKSCRHPRLWQQRCSLLSRGAFRNIHNQRHSLLKAQGHNCVDDHLSLSPFPDTGQRLGLCVVWNGDDQQVSRGGGVSIRQAANNGMRHRRPNLTSGFPGPFLATGPNNDGPTRRCESHREPKPFRPGAADKGDALVGLGQSTPERVRLPQSYSVRRRNGTRATGTPRAQMERVPRLSGLFQREVSAGRSSELGKAMARPARNRYCPCSQPDCTAVKQP